MTLPRRFESSAPLSLSSKTCRACSLPPDDSPIAYAAGIFDGEGTLVISSTTTNGRTRYWPLMAVRMAKPHALNVLWATFGGRLGSDPRRRPGNAGILRWEMSGVGVQCPLRHMLPFLRVKRAQAELVLEMLGRAWPASENGRGISWTPEISEEWAAAKTRMEDLNARGMAVPGEEIALLVGDQWMIPQSDLFGERWETFSGRFPTSGSLRNGALYARPTLAPPISGSGGSASPGLPTPTARDGKGTGFEGQLPNVIELLPTPTTSESTGVGDLAGNRNDTLRARVALLPTPRASAQENRQTKRSPTQKAGKHGLCLAAEVSELNQASAVTQLLSTPRASDTGTPGRRASEGFRPPLSQVLLPTPTATPYGNNQSPSPGATVRPSLDSLASSGALTAPPSPAGNTSSDAPHPVQLTIEDALTPDSSNG